MAYLLTAIIVFWLCLLGAGIAGVRLLRSASRTKRVAGTLFLVSSCALALGTIFQREIDDWVFSQRTTTPAHPPRAVVFRSDSTEIEHIAAALVATGSFDVFVTLPTKGWLFNADPILVEKTAECALETTPVLLLKTMRAECIHRKRAVPLPACRIEIDLEGQSPSIEHVAQTARIYAVREAGQPCPFFDAMLPAIGPNPVAARLLPSFGRRPITSISAMRLHASVTSPTLESILQAIGN